MRTQRLRHTVEVQKPTRTRDSLGDAVPSWTTVQDRPAAITPLSARDRLQADQRLNDITHRVRMWWFEGLTHDYRLKLNSRIFEISSILNKDERNKIMELLCTEQAASA